MNVDVSGSTIRLTNTKRSDIERIIGFEKQNAWFVGSYSSQKHLELITDKDCLHLSVRTQTDDALVGHIILFGLTNEHESIEFRRITIGEKGKGYGRETIQVLKKLCFVKLKAHRLWLDVFDDNPRAWKLYESEGFVQEGLLRENTKTDRGYRSQRLYSLLLSEYQTD